MRLAVALMFCLLPFGVYAQQNARAQEAEITRQQRKLNRVFRYLTDTYVDDIDPKASTEAAIRAMLAELDPHSTYLTAEEMTRAKETFSGEFYGIGIEFNSLRDTIIAANVVPDGPAARAGMRPNDRIIRIDTTSAIGLPITQIPNLLRGPRGKRVTLEVIRRDSLHSLRFNVARDRIPLHTVDAAYVIDDHIGYIRVNRFGHTTMQEFRQAFASLGDIQGLILDLRGNGGGILGQAVELAGFFLPRNRLILSTEGRAIPPTKLHTTKEGECTTAPLVVLIDEQSASGSEIVAGAIQDWDRGVIAGRPSFGKGLVQRQYLLEDGSAIRLTIARYHTPSGRVIQRPYTPGKRAEYYTASRKPDSMDRPVYKTLQSQRTVYGGGGITPDVLVPIDTTFQTPCLVELLRRGIISEFCVDYLDRNRTELEFRYPSPEDFAREFDPSVHLLPELIAYAQRQGIQCDVEQVQPSADWLSRRLCADIARRLYGIEAAVQIMNNKHDPIFMCGFEILRHWDTQEAQLLAPEN